MKKTAVHLRYRWSALLVGGVLVLGLSLLLAAGSLRAESSAAKTTLAQVTWPNLASREVASGLTEPVYITHAGDGSGRLFVVELDGTIRIIKDGTVQDPPFLDISERVAKNEGERGLLSVVFPPQYASKGYFYVNYTREPDGATVVGRYRLQEGNPDQADPTSEEVVLEIAQPDNNHNGGDMAFGPDGYLYIATGDGGGAGDPNDNGQKTDTLLGKILRIDVESDMSPYAIPDDNPFVDNGEYKLEIWALGLRNPWRFSFDRETGDMYIADVGQGIWEEINYQPANSGGGENYGWRCKEGRSDFTVGVPPCDDPDFLETLVPPVLEYKHELGRCSVTGGYVYRGTQHASMEGIYFYADYCTGEIWGAQRENGEWVSSDVLLNEPYLITSFGEDEAGNLYVAAFDQGRILELFDSTTLPPDQKVITDTLTPDTGIERMIDDETLEINLTIPEQAVTSTTVISYTSMPTDTIIGDLPGSGEPLYRFTLEASSEDGQPVLQFGVPYTLTLQGITITETETLLVYQRSEDGTLTACAACSLSITPQEVSITNTRPGELVLVRRQNLPNGPRLFLPLVRRS